MATWHRAIAKTKYAHRGTKLAQNEPAKRTIYVILMHYPPWSLPSSIRASLLLLPPLFCSWPIVHGYFRTQHVEIINWRIVPGRKSTTSICLSSRKIRRVVTGDFHVGRHSTFRVSDRVDGSYVCDSRHSNTNISLVRSECSAECEFEDEE